MNVFKELSALFWEKATTKTLANRVTFLMVMIYIENTQQFHCFEVTVCMLFHLLC